MNMLRNRTLVSIQFRQLTTEPPRNPGSQRINRFERRQKRQDKKLSQEKLRKLYSGPGLDTFLGPGGCATLGQLNEEKYVRTSGKDVFRLPPWLKVEIPVGKEYAQIKKQIKENKLETVCEQAKCPNIGECWNTSGDKLATATIMVMGEECTRGCRFCSDRTNKKPALPDKNEPRNIAKAIESWKTGYIVITSVDRDDLPDGGASHFADTVRAIKSQNSKIMLETLVGDFQGNMEDVATVVNSGMEVFAHNIETVRSLLKRIKNIELVLYSLRLILSVIFSSSKIVARLFTPVI